MKIYSVNDKKFSRFGRVLSCPITEELDENLSKIALPESGTAYRASEPVLEFESAKKYFTAEFGETEIQIGICMGRNNVLNALEWHKSSEINYAFNDLILLLADIRDMKDNKINSNSVTAFLVKKGECVEVYSTSLHFCPIALNGNSFKCVVVLPKGTNTDLDKEYDDKLLIRKNKWLICHKDAENLVKAGRVIGIEGENIVL